MKSFYQLLHPPVVRNLSWTISSVGCTALRCRLSLRLPLRLVGRCHSSLDLFLMEGGMPTYGRVLCESTPKFVKPDLVETRRPRTLFAHVHSSMVPRCVSTNVQYAYDGCKPTSVEGAWSGSPSFALFDPSCPHDFYCSMCTRSEVLSTVLFTILRTATFFSIAINCFLERPRTKSSQKGQRAVL